MRLNIVSIGSECDVKYQINKYLNINKETDFFDWLITDMVSVCDILSKDINTILTFPNIKLIGYKNRNAIVQLKNCNKIISMHDIPINYSFNNIYSFILKYKRRYNRLIELIKSNSKTYFIRRDNPLEKEIIKLMKILNIINPNNNITLILYISPYSSRTKNLGYIKKLKSQIPDLIDLSKGYEDSLFYNCNHLNNEGAKSFTSKLYSFTKDKIKL